MTRETEDVVTERFFIDHGMIHDRVTGRHVSTEPVERDEGEWDHSPVTETCALLNELVNQSLSDRIDELEGALRQCARLARMESSSLASAIVETVNASLRTTHREG